MVDGGRCWPSLLMFLRFPSRIAAMLGSASCGNSSDLNVNCAGSQHTTHADVPSDSTIEYKDGVSVLFNDIVWTSISSTDGDFERRRDYLVGCAISSGFIELVV